MTVTHHCHGHEPTAPYPLPYAPPAYPWQTYGPIWVVPYWQYAPVWFGVTAAPQINHQTWNTTTEGYR